MNKSKLAGLLIVLALLLGGCSDYLVKRLAFHPMGLQPSDYELTDDRILELSFESADQVKLHAFYIPYPQKQNLVIFFHGNFGNALHRIVPAWELAKTGVNVLLVSYRGYGLSEGEPSEAGLYRDAVAAINFATQTLGYQPGHVFLLGRSLGSAVAVEAAQERGLGGLILISPFPSGRAVMEAQGLGWLDWFVFGTPFNSADKVKRLSVPGLFIHGDQDRLIPLTLSRRLYQAYSSPYKSLAIVPGAGHNDLFRIAGPRLWERVAAFVQAPEQEQGRIGRL